ncbi:MAG: sigma-70 family RNA polymerase sigma factor [Chryseolinea sp.]
MTNETDLLIIDRILAGDQAAYAGLVDKYKRYAYTIAWKILGNKADAEDAAQDGFIKAYHHLKSFQRESKFSTWLYRIVFNTAISHKRKNKHTFQSIENTIIEYSYEAQGGLEKNDKQYFVHLAMSRLNQADRGALSMFYMDEFSLEEIADITGMAANTLKVRIHRARLRLAEQLKLILKTEAITL